MNIHTHTRGTTTKGCRSMVKGPAPLRTTVFVPAGTKVHRCNCGECGGFWIVTSPSEVPDLRGNGLERAEMYGLDVPRSYVAAEVVS